MRFKIYNHVCDECNNKIQSQAASIQGWIIITLQIKQMYPVDTDPINREYCFCCLDCYHQYLKKAVK